jgi:ectoine hydroxylase-related dioxygenase (phytanoyl-CoA dioxygenase family)
MLSKFFVYIDIILGRIIFSSLLPFSYCLINKKIDKKINNKSKSSYYSIKINEKGFFIFKKKYEKFADSLNLIIKKQISENNIVIKDVFYFKIDNKIKSLLRDFLNNEAKELFQEIYKIFGLKIFITNIILRRTVNINAKEEIYNNFFHFDKYTKNHIKIFFNLHDMNKDNGPTKIIPKLLSKKLLKNNFFKKRGDYVSNENKINGVYKNEEKKGSFIICNTTECLHAASIPTSDNFRDILTITTVATPMINSNNIFFLDNKENEKYFWNGNSDLSKKFAKPKIKDLFKFYQNF